MEDLERNPRNIGTLAGIAMNGMPVDYRAQRTNLSEGNLDYSVHLPACFQDIERKLKNFEERMQGEQLKLWIDSNLNSVLTLKV